MRIARIFATLLAACALAGCATAPRHPAIAAAREAGTLPPLVPMRRFVANIDYAGGYSVSPDGTQLVWSQAVGTDSGLAVRDAAGGPARTFATGFLARPAGPVYAWLPDSRHVAYLKDLRGDENTQLHVFDTRAPFAPWAVTPWPGVRSIFIAAGPQGSAKFYFASNRRDRSTLDLYEADAAARTVREVSRSDGNVLWWLVGTDQQPAARARQLEAREDSDRAIEVLDGGGNWKTVRVVSAWDQFWLHRMDRQAGKAWGLSSVGRDKSALVEFDLASGRETVLAAEPEVDVDTVYYERGRGQPLAYFAEPGYPHVRYLERGLAGEIDRAVQRAMDRGLLAERPRYARPQSITDDGQRWVLRAVGDHEDAELLLDRATGELARLDPPEPEKRALLSTEVPYSFTTSDGRKVHGYLVRPRGVAGAAPLVVNVHGGPWARDRWNSAAFNTTQMLANRGYAVMTVNYRGSSGYGREFMRAGDKVYYTRLQQDIAEAVQWAVDRGFADPRRMAVLGGSFGGFSVLAQLQRKDHDWKCGVDVVGVANWPRVIETWPPYWRGRHVAHAFYGDPADPVQRAEMLANSPISHLDRITAPLLVIHGANDVRVLRQDSDDVVAGLRALGRPVEYLSFPDEGHQVRRWRNRMEMWRRVEDKLAACLGGRSAGWDFYELMPRSQ